MKKEFWGIPLEEWGKAAALILGARMAVFAAAYAGVVIYAGLSLPPSDIFKIWCQWDARWYVWLAENGYINYQHFQGIVYFPLYPWLIRFFSFVIPDLVMAAMVIANAASFAALLVFYALCRFEFAKDKAVVSLGALLLFPTAFFFYAPYTEGLFLLFAIGSFYTARRENWAAAGLLAGLATLTRMTGLCLLPALIVEYVLQRKEGRPRRWFDLLPLLAIPAAYGGYLWLNYAATGNAFEYVKVYSTIWYRRLTWPWVGIGRLLGALSGYRTNPLSIVVPATELVAVVVFLAAAVRSLRFHRLSYGVLMGCMALLAISNSVIFSTPRYLLVAFPLFFVGPEMKFKRPVAAIMVAGLVVLTVRFVTQRWAY